MKYREELLRNYSSALIRSIVSDIGNNPAKFADLTSLLSDNDPLISQRAAWPLSYVIENHPNIALPHIPVFMDLLTQRRHVAVKRNILRGFQFVNIPDEYLGTILDICYSFIRSVKEGIAVRAFAMTVVANACKIYPDLKHELIITLEALVDDETPGIRSRARNTLKQISSTYKKPTGYCNRSRNLES